MNAFARPLLPFVLALLVTIVLVLVVGASPAEALSSLWDGAFGNLARLNDVLAAWVPITLCATGLLLTFTAGLWNIGIEGQIIAGAIAATWVVRNFNTLPASLLLPLVILGGALGGALWGWIAGLLKVYGHVHEIFGGTGLNFVAIGLTNYLIFGPWKQAGRATASGTEPYPTNAWLPTLSDWISTDTPLRLSPIAFALALLCLVIAHAALRNTTWGLRLKAIGKNARAAFLLGVPTQRYVLWAFALCGVCAGLAGAVQTTVTYHRLIPAISSGYGFLALLVVMLAGFRALGVAPVAFAFSALNLGSLQLQLNLQLDSSLGGIIQGILVLLVVLLQRSQPKQT